MIVLDTSAIYTFYDRSDTWHLAVKELFFQATSSLILPSSVIPELDYLLGKRLGRRAREAFLEDIILGVYTTSQLLVQMYLMVQELDARYSELDLGFVDASVIITARWLQCSQIATLDHRHFSPIAREYNLQLLPYTK
jgi:uncharacterized protein